MVFLCVNYKKTENRVTLKEITEFGYTVDKWLRE